MRETLKSFAPVIWIAIIVFGLVIIAVNNDGERVQQTPDYLK